MAEFEGIEEMVNQASIQAATVVMIPFRDVNVGSQPVSTTSPRKPEGHRNSGLALERPLLNCNTQDRYVELMNFEMEVTNILEMKGRCK